MSSAYARCSSSGLFAAMRVAPPLVGLSHFMENAMVAKVARELREDREHRLCAVCLRAERSTLLLPCRHRCLCEGCAASVRQTSGRCPLCRETIESSMRVFS